MRQLAAIAGVAVAISATCTSCNNPNLSRRELVVVFAPTSPAADHAAALHACANATPKASPEPLPTSSTPVSTRLNDVRFRIDHASDRDINILLQCLRRQPGVIGFQQPEADG